MVELNAYFADKYICVDKVFINMLNHLQAEN